MLNFEIATTDYGGYLNSFWSQVGRECITRYESSGCDHDCHDCPGCYTCADAYRIAR